MAFYYLSLSETSSASCVSLLQKGRGLTRIILAIFGLHIVNRRAIGHMDTLRTDVEYVSTLRLKLCLFGFKLGFNGGRCLAGIVNSSNMWNRDPK